MKGGGSTPFSPASLANLAAWYRADLGVSLNGSTVSGWSDLSSNAKHFSQGTPANQPTYNATDSNFAGTPSIQGDGSNDVLSTASNLGITGTVWTVIAALVDTSTTAAVVLEYGPTAQTAGAAGIFANDVVAGRVNSNLGGTGAASWGQYATEALSSPRVLSFRADRSVPNMDLRINGATQALTTYVGSTANVSATFASGALSIFARAGAVAPWAGRIAELVIYSSLLSDADTSRVERYIGARCGITVA